MAFNHVCPICEASFVSDRRDSKYCSRSCINKSRAIFKDVTKTCATCHIAFTFRPSAKRPDQECCSIECSNTYRAGIINQQKPSAIRPCAQCGNDFEPYRSGAICCSVTCSNRYRGEGTISKPCAGCGQDFESDVIRNRLFCSPACRNRTTNIQRFGPSRKPRMYYGPNWHSQRILALKRDGYSCQNCGAKRTKKGKHPHVHHIRPFRQFSGDYELANHLNNLICLCRKCHPLAENGKIPIQPSLF